MKGDYVLKALQAVKEFGEFTIDSFEAFQISFVPLKMTVEFGRIL